MKPYFSLAFLAGGLTAGLDGIGDNLEGGCERAADLARFQPNLEARGVLHPGALVGKKQVERCDRETALGRAGLPAGGTHTAEGVGVGVAGTSVAPRRERHSRMMSFSFSGVMVT